VLKVAYSKSAIKLVFCQMLQRRSGILHTWSIALSFLSLNKHVANQSAQATRGVKAYLKWLSRKEFMNTLNPKVFNGIEINLIYFGLRIKEGDIFAHIVDTSSTSATTFCCEYSSNVMPFENCLYSPFA